MFRYSPAEMEEMEKQMRQLLELGYIQPSLFQDDE
jgi:ribulose bisphosphate carboxylase small subunit